MMEEPTTNTVLIRLKEEAERFKQSRAAGYFTMLKRTGKV